MFTRRSFLQSGLSAAALGVLSRRGLSLTVPASTGIVPPVIPLRESAPFAPISTNPTSVMVDGLPFSDWYTGDDFRHNADIPFHGNERCFHGGLPPAPTEEVDIAVVGGGISGLSTAYLLRNHRPVVFEIHNRFGGAAQGEVWGDTHYSLGNAYVITPDAGGFLENLYRELGLDKVVRVNEGDFEFETHGQIIRDLFGPTGPTPADARAFARYREIVLNMANVDYPDIPLPAGKDNQWILDLDRKTFRQDIEEQMGMPVPARLAAAIQAYCYSSFAAGWEEISAASGWNFLAAEEYGRWVFPGGTPYMATQFWNALAKLDAGQRVPRLRAGTRVVDVRLTVNDRVQVTYTGADGKCRSLLAKSVAMCCPKMVCKNILHDIQTLDPPKFAAMDHLRYRAYVVVNVLLHQPVRTDFYDVFLLGDGAFAMSEPQAQADSRVIDMLSGHYARKKDSPSGVLTLYWPLPFNFGRWTLLTEPSWQNYAAAVVPQIRSMLRLLHLGPEAVTQVRLTRWGHAMPIAQPNLMADGVIDHLRRPIGNKIFFIHQDNWALPAVENCLLDAEIFVPHISAAL